MKIKKLEYYDEEYQWKLEAVEFSQNLNLLVGVSGAGKTQILNAIRRLKKISNGKSLNGVQWNIEFSTNGKLEYHWQGKFETRKINQLILDELDDEKDSDFESEKSKILYEHLSCNGKIIIDRNEDQIKFKGNLTPKLSPFKSAIDILSPEEDIIPVKEEFSKITFIDYENIGRKLWRLPISTIKKYENCSLKRLQESGLPTQIKLSILYKYLPEEFIKIKNIFANIFAKVVDVKIEGLDKNKLPIPLLDIFRDATTISIKEKEVDNWIEDISSGMFKTLMYIGELHLSPEGSVILIDEFENSLGVNCIDSVTELILERQDLQFMITSHHPYIINNISPKYWKIVTRQGSLVTVKEAKEFHISESRQKAFIDLINVLQNEDEDLED